ncbi:winged helix-turn-helix transcriptional regulator [Staphylococcus lutrae]
MEDELIYKIVLSEKPVRSVYKIAPKGKMLETVLLNLREFGLTNLNKN